MQPYPVVWALLALLPTIRAALTPSRGYDDDNTSLRLSLEDLEREQEQQQLQQQQLRHHHHHNHLDLNRPPLLPNHYEWHPSVAASLPPSYVHDAAQLERAERLRELQQQHQQLSAGYALPGELPDGLLLLTDSDIAATPATAIDATTTTAATAAAATAGYTKTATRLVQPIVPFDLDLQLQLNGVQYLNGNALPGSSTPLLARPLPLARPVTRPVRPPAYTFVQHAPSTPSSHSPPSRAIPLLLPQSKQYAYAPFPQRNYAPGAARIPLPYPPSFISITTTRRPGGLGTASGYSGSYVKPFRPSQPDLTPDLFAGRESKSLIDSYIPSWEVLRLIQQHQQHQQHLRPLQRQTLAYAVPNLRVFKRDSQLERSRIVKKSLPQNAPHK